MAVVDAIIFSNDKQFAEIARNQLQLKSISNIVEHSAVSDVLHSVERFPTGLFVLDWNGDEAACVRILKKCVFLGGLASRPILLASLQMSDSLISVALEYGVTQIHIGTYEAKELASNIGHTIRRGTARSAFKDDLMRVQRARIAQDFTGMKRILTDLCDKNPDSLFLRAELAESYFQDGLAKEALKILTPLPEMNPPNIKYLHIYARSLMKVGIYKEAEAIYSKITLLNPFDPEKLVGLGEVLLNIGKNEKAEEAFDSALALDSNNKEALHGKGKVRLIDGEINEALEMVQGTVSPVELAAMFNSSAVMLIRRGNFDAGMKLYDAAINAVGDKSPRTQAKLYFNMGVGYRRLKDPQNAKKCFESACRSDPDYSVAQANLEQMDRIIKRSSYTIVSDDSRKKQGDMSYTIEGVEERIAGTPNGQTIPSPFEDDFTDDSQNSSKNKNNLEGFDDFGLEETIFS